MKLLTAVSYIAKNIILYYILSYQYMIRNKLANKYTKKVYALHNIKELNNKPITLSNLKSYLK